jgi:hypothetical protein
LKGLVECPPIIPEGGCNEYVGVPAAFDDARYLSVRVRSHPGRVVIDHAGTDGVSKAQPLGGSYLGHPSVAVFAVMTDAKRRPASETFCPLARSYVQIPCVEAAGGTE